MFSPIRKEFNESPNIVCTKMVCLDIMASSKYFLSATSMSHMVCGTQS